MACRGLKIKSKYDIDTQYLGGINTHEKGIRVECIVKNNYYLYLWHSYQQETFVQDHKITIKIHCIGVYYKN